MQQTSDAELMASAGRGDEDAFARLVDRHKDAVLGYLCRLTPCRERAEELAQETFLRLYQSAGRYRENGHLKAYLFRIATNLARSDARRARRRHLLGGPDASLGTDLDALPGSSIRVNGFHHDAADGRTPQTDVLRAELHEKLAAAVAELPMHYRVPLVLHEIEEWSYPEIARVTGSRQGTVKSRISRGRRLLRDRLGPILERT